MLAPHLTTGFPRQFRNSAKQRIFLSHLTKGFPRPKVRVPLVKFTNCSHFAVHPKPFLSRHSTRRISQTCAPVMATLSVYLLRSAVQLSRYVEELPLHLTTGFPKRFRNRYEEIIFPSYFSTGFPKRIFKRQNEEFMVCL